MRSPQPSAAMDRANPSLALRASNAPRSPGGPTVIAALLVGVTLAAAILYTFHFGPLRDTKAQRYVSHPVECVEVLMFCCALGALGAKLLQNVTERRALGALTQPRSPVLPSWDGQPVPITEAGRLLAGLQELHQRFQGTAIVKRVHAVLDFLCRRNSANELDDHLRDLADGDALALENSYSLIRFITWAIPILGFLGTVLGITGAISGVTPEVLEKDLSRVTDGLALAFDTTALALGLTMITMFLSFVIERAEQSVLEAVDRYAARQLAHRFERTGAEGSKFVEVVIQNSKILLQATEQLVQRQAELWAGTLAEADRRRSEAEKHQQQLLTQALEQALERTQESHAQRLAALEKQAGDQNAALLERLAAVVNGMATQAEALARLQEGEKQLLRLQELLSQNLTALAATGTFEQAVHSLTAAIHLLTARSAATPPASAANPAARPGKAA